MINVLYFALVAIVSYLIGTINFSKILAWNVKRKDITKIGSGNPGTMNMLRSFGFVMAILTFVAEVVKAGLVCLIASIILPEFAPMIHYFAGAFVLLGYNFPLWSKFKGGKGALVAATSLLAIDPLVFCIEIPVFIIVILFTKYVSVGSITAAALYPLLTGALQYIRGGYENVWLHTILAAAIALTVIFRHSANIKRLMSGTENKFSFKKNKEA